MPKLVCGDKFVTELQSVDRSVNGESWQMLEEAGTPRMTSETLQNHQL